LARIFSEVLWVFPVGSAAGNGKQTRTDRTVASLVLIEKMIMNSELRRCGREQSWSPVRYYKSIFLVRLRKTMEKPHSRPEVSGSSEIRSTNTKYSATAFALIHTCICSVHITERL
jgi:hypothetical protein